MHRDVIDVLDRKLLAALREVDAGTELGIRAALSNVGPDPKSPFVSQVMVSILEACAKGHRKRVEISRRIVEETVAPHHATLEPTDVDSILEVVAKHFPPDTYVELVGHTPGVFERSQAPLRKFLQKDFDLQFALVKTSAHSMSTRAVSEARLYLDEQVLLASVSRPSVWQMFHKLVWHGITKPMIKWFGSLLSALIVAYLVWYIGLS